MRWLYYSIWLSIAISFLCVYSVANAQTVTTGNLLPNANDGVDWNSSSTDQINPGSSGTVTSGNTVNGFNITCPGQSNCGYKYSVGGDFEVTGTATVSVENIKLYSNTITQSKLDNGITLDSYIDVANCESTQGNCESKGGSNDSHTTTITLKDSQGNVLSTLSQTRTEVTGFQGNCNGYPGSSGAVATACGQYNDRIIYMGVGANNVDWSWSGTDSNYTNQFRQGPNLLGARLDMTYTDTEYNPIDEDAQEAIDDIVEVIDDIPEDFFEEEFTFDDEIIIIDLLPEAVPEQITFEDIESFEEFEEMFIVEEEMEIIEEAEIEVIEEEEIEVAEMEAEAEAEPTMEIEEEAPIEETEEPTKEVQNEETMEDSGESMEEEPENKESVSEASKDEDETTEEAEPDSEESEDTEIQTAEAGDEEKVSTKSEKQIEISADVGGTTVKLKNVEKQLSKIDRMLIQPELDSYEEVQFYESKDIYQDANLELFENQVDLGSYSVQIYAGVTLSAYSANDPMQIFEERMEFLARQKLSIMLELKKLKEN